MDIRPVIERAGSRIHAGTDGPDGGPLVALTHGASMDHRMFEPQLEPLTTAGYRVLTWDLRGHGRSKPICWAPMSLRTSCTATLTVSRAWWSSREPA